MVDAHQRGGQAFFFGAQLWRFRHVRGRGFGTWRGAGRAGRREQRAQRSVGGGEQGVG
jgi:hypothetical protein